MNDEELTKEFIRITRVAHQTLVQVAMIEWPHPHEPVTKWVNAVSVEGDLSETDVGAEVRKILGTIKYFRVCNQCGKRKPAGWMHDFKICQTCAERDHGVVY